jgi:hypothetical protein
MTAPEPPLLKFVARILANVDPPMEVGHIASGVREMIPITGGTAEGLIEGVILPGGADWAINHDNGKATIWARYAIKRADGSLIMVTNSGNASEQRGGSWRGHTVPRLEAGAEDLKWLNTAVLVGTLHATEGVVELVWWQVV